MGLQGNEWGDRMGRTHKLRDGETLEDCVRRLLKTLREAQKRTRVTKVFTHRIDKEDDRVISVTLSVTCGINTGSVVLSHGISHRKKHIHPTTCEKKYSYTEPRALEKYMRSLEAEHKYYVRRKKRSGGELPNE